MTYFFKITLFLDLIFIKKAYNRDRNLFIGPAGPGMPRQAQQ
jgi:hypothetical protein